MKVMMKKEYIAPEILLRQVISERFMGESVVIEKGDEDWGFEDTESKGIDDKSFDVWED